MISPERPQVTNKQSFPVSKIPLFILYLCNYMLYEPQKKCLTIIQVVLAIITHFSGITLMAIYIYGVLTAEPLLDVPVLLIYEIIFFPVCLAIHAYLFIFKSWRLKTFTVLRLLDQPSAPFLWSKSDKLYLMIMTGFAGISLVTAYKILTKLFQSDLSLKIIFHFVQYKNVPNIFSNLIHLYIVYLSIILSIFPVYLSYLCFNLNKIVDILQQRLREIMQNNNITIVENFEQFVQKFEEMLMMISETDDCHSINIACFISVKVHCIIMWIYTGTALKACNPLQSKSFYASCDSISLLFTLLVLSSLASKVNIYSNRNLNFGVKIEFCSLGKKAVLLF